MKLQEPLGTNLQELNLNSHQIAVIREELKRVNAEARIEGASIAAQTINHIAESLTGFGGHLECMECGHTQPLGDVGNKLAHGWPMHCGYTMRWITASQEQGTDLPKEDPEATT